MGIREDLLKLSVEIGPRGACTAAEARAADYIERRFAERGLAVSTQEFPSITTYSYLYIIYLAVAAACGVLSYWFHYYAAPVAFANGVLFVLDLETFPVLSRVMPRKTSRNVIAEVPSDTGKVGLVVTAHYDSARAGLSFHPKLVGSFRSSFNLMIGAVLAVSVLTACNLVLAVAAGEVNFWVWIATLAVSAYLLFPIAVMVHREVAMDFTPGANDNASGVVALLALADKISEDESRIPGVMLVATGAEEVGTVGMQWFLKGYRERVRDAMFVNLDNLGTGHLCCIDSEGMLLGHDANPVLLWLADKVAEKKRLPVWRTGYRLLSTDATPALARGYQAMSLMAFDDEGMLPNWHWQTDTADNVSMENLEITRAFLWNLVRRLDL
jgi:hypothetical protein